MKKTNVMRNIGLASAALLLSATGAGAGAGAGTDSGATRLLWFTTSPDPVKASPNDDPVERFVRIETRAQLPELHRKSVPFLRIDIPDPLETSRHLGLRDQPADNDAPVMITSELPKPPAPITTPATAPVKQ